MDRYDLAAQAADNRLWDWDLTTSRIHFSPGWISMLGCEEGGFGNTPEEWFKRIHPEDFESVQSEIKTHLETGSAQFEIEHRMLHQDGCYRWMSCRGTITRDDAGRAVRITGFHLDITDEKVVDALTGLPNRLLLLDRLTRSIEKAKKDEDFLFAVLILDLNLFESGINRLETLNGDSLIIAAARRLETSLRSEDSLAREGCEHLVARSGGDEFIILLDGLREMGEAKTIAERLLNEMLLPFEFYSREVFLSASIGVALSATRYRNAEESLRDADTALYRAKSFGKSRCEVFDTAILESAQTARQLEADLQRALSRNEFAVFYQPIISLDSNQIAGLEALVRWKHPSRGMVFPMEFIPVAEKSGFIVPLERWVLQNACRQLKTWKQNPRISKDLWISVNLSSTEFVQPYLAKEIREILLEVDFDASNLMLELTEGAVMQNPEAARSLLMQLRVMGARIALDDFGTGYSSLAHLGRLPLDYLKIDYTFVRSIESSPDIREIIRTICVMARQLGLRVVAEGIENPRQLELIRSFHCEYAQGFLFSKAVSSEETEALLLDGLSSCRDVRVPTSSPGKSDLETDAFLHPTSAFPVSDLNQESHRKRTITPEGKWVFIGSTALVLLLMAGLFAKLNRVTSPPVAFTDTPSLQARVEGLEKAPALLEIAETPLVEESQKIPTADIEPKPLAAVPKAVKKDLPESVYSYPVLHDHFLGHCRGTIEIARNNISFISEEGKDSFDLKYSECSYSLEGDQLTIKSKSRTYHFKSATARTKDENRSHLLAIYQTISRLHQIPASKKQ